MGNLRRPNSNEANGTYNRSESVVPSSGLCSRCIDGCRGGCEIFKSSFRGREVLYPKGFGAITSGSDKNYPIDYSHLSIQGYAVGAEGLPEGMEACSNNAIFPNVNTEMEYGWSKKIKMKVPIFTGAIGSTEIAKKNWEHLAAGAAISGISIVVGENVCGMDSEAKFDSNKKVIYSPEMDRRINSYRKYYEGFGEIRVQMNVEDTRLGVAEYVSGKHDLETIELKWGQGAKCIGGEVKLSSIEKAISMKHKGYIVTPNPEDPLTKTMFASGGVKEFERHSRVGFVTKEGFLSEVDRLHDMGFKRVTLKTGAYSMKELAMAMRYASDAKIDLLTIDGAGGGTGMSPLPMMLEYGIPTFYLQSLAYEFAEKLKKKGMRVSDLAMAGGFSSEDGVYKALAMGSPYFKAVCMGRALMIPGFVGKNIGKWIENKDLPRTVSEFGEKPEEIFVCYEELAAKFGNEMKDLPLGALGIYTYVEKFKTGLQQLMAGSRKFNLSVLNRGDVMALTEEASKVSGISYIMDAYRDEAETILEG
jgi:glutamate synthase domain-containing protein 2